MKKVTLNKMENTVGGAQLTCGWVGVLGAASLFGGITGIGAIGLYYLSSDIKRCWNS